MAGVLELLGEEFNTVMVNMLGDLMGKVNNMQAQMDKHRDEHSKKDQEEILEKKNTVKKMKIVFHGLISRPDTGGERVSDLDTWRFNNLFLSNTQVNEKTQKKF